MSNPKEGPSKAMWGIVISSLLISLSTFLVLGELGPNVSRRLWYPFFTLVGYIQAFGFIQGIEPIIIGIWLLSVFIKLSLYLFITSYGTAQYLNIKKWRIGIWFVLAIGFIFSLLPHNIVESSVILPKGFFLRYMVPITYIGIPIFLFSVGLIRKKSVKWSFKKLIIIINLIYCIYSLGLK
jgi:spore germination protein KB